MNKGSKVVAKFYCCGLLFLGIISTCSGQNLSEKCQPSENEVGICTALDDCHDIINPETEPDKVCSLNEPNPIVCCSNPKIDTSKNVVSPNEFCIHHNCGIQNTLPFHSITLEDGEIQNIYYLNRTADLLESEGFNVSVDLTFDDAIRSFNFTNGTFSGRREAATIMGKSSLAFSNSVKHKSHYMALLGERKGENIEWDCEGVLINNQWVLSAAHCFSSSKININVIRLGELDFKVPAGNPFDNYPVDHTIEEVVIYPLYTTSSGYHDLALIKLSEKIGKFHNNIAPICLPWGEETNRKQFSSIVTVSGWGPSAFRGFTNAKRTILTQETMLVFDTQICATTFTIFANFRTKWAHGMNESNIMCAAAGRRGPNACTADSGAPLVYQRSDDKLVLGGIATLGFGCGPLENMPGLYVPINNPLYLQWIKDVSFNECSNSTTE